MLVNSRRRSVPGCRGSCRMRIDAGNPCTFAVRIRGRRCSSRVNAITGFVIDAMDGHSRATGLHPIHESVLQGNFRGRQCVFVSRRGDGVQLSRNDRAHSGSSRAPLRQRKSPGERSMWVSASNRAGGGTGVRTYERCVNLVSTCCSVMQSQCTCGGRSCLLLRSSI